eukprot:753804-Hanusia_phi.AAC.1
MENNKVSAQLKYYRKKISSDPDFYKAELGRTSSYIKNRYQNDPEFKARLIAQAKERYQRQKLQSVQTA